MATEASQGAPAGPPETGAGERRLRIAGLHHLTLICSDLERSVAFYRDLLGMRLVKQTRNFDDPEARHLYLGDSQGAPRHGGEPARVPADGPGSSRRRLDASFRAVRRIRGRARTAGAGTCSSRGVGCTEVLDRTYFKSIYLRDPDGHVVEIATRGPGFTVDEPVEELGQRVIDPPG